MGLLILEQKELTSKYEQAKASAEAAELKYKRNQAAHVSGLAEARKREEALRKSLGVEKECIASVSVITKFAEVSRSFVCASVMFELRFLLTNIAA